MMELCLSSTQWVTFEVDMQLLFSLCNNHSYWLPKQLLLSKLPSLLCEREGWGDYPSAVIPLGRAPAHCLKERPGRLPSWNCQFTEVHWELIPRAMNEWPEWPVLRAIYLLPFFLKHRTADWEGLQPVTSSSNLDHSEQHATFFNHCKVCGLLS